MSLLLLDVAPDPVGIGIVAAVIIFVLALVAFLAVALVVFLWYRKRKMRESPWPESRAAQSQPNNPNHP